MTRNTSAFCLTRFEGGAYRPFVARPSLTGPLLGKASFGGGNSSDWVLAFLFRIVSAPSTCSTAEVCRVTVRRASVQIRTYTVCAIGLICDKCHKTNVAKAGKYNPDETRRILR